MEFLYHKVEFLYHNNVGVIIPRILIYRLKTVSNEYMCSSVYCDANKGQGAEFSHFNSAMYKVFAFQASLKS